MEVSNCELRPTSWFVSLICNEGVNEIIRLSEKLDIQEKLIAESKRLNTDPLPGSGDHFSLMAEFTEDLSSNLLGLHRKLPTGL